jgi:SAM-dependent methyltransferase
MADKRGTISGSSSEHIVGSMPHHSLSSWFDTPLGAYVLEREQAYFDEAVADIFGFNALQLGLSEQDFLRANRMPLRLKVGPGEGADVRCAGEMLPIATQSMDLVVLAHVLEFARDPHALLREVDRVMMPEGRVIITGFNPWSLWGLRQVFAERGDPYPWRGHFISLVRLKDWLQLLGFDVSAGRLGCYAPPFRNPKWLERFSFMEAAGDRWWGLAGGVYMVQAIKRVVGMRLITPKWNANVSTQGRVVTATQRAARTAVPNNVVQLRTRKRQPLV